MSIDIARLSIADQESNDGSSREMKIGRESDFDRHDFIRITYILVHFYCLHYPNTNHKLTNSGPKSTI